MGESMGLQQVPPLYLMCGAPPSGAMNGDGFSGSFLERGTALRLPFHGQGVAASARQLAVREGFLSGLGERNQGIAAQAERSGFAMNDQALQPAPSTVGINAKVQAISVAVETIRPPLESNTTFDNNSPTPSAARLSSQERVFHCGPYVNKLWFMHSRTTMPGRD